MQALLPSFAMAVLPVDRIAPQVNAQQTIAAAMNNCEFFISYSRRYARGVISCVLLNALTSDSSDFLEALVLEYGNNPCALPVCMALYLRA